MFDAIAQFFPGVTAEYGAFAFWFAVGGFFVAGFVKGTIAFALPLVSVSIASLVLPPQVTVALVAVPAFVTNLLQALRTGPAAALGTLREFWRLIAALLLALVLAAQLLPSMDRQTFSIFLGSAVLLFALAQLAGWRPEVPPHRRGLLEVLTGIFAGVCGGIAGTWGAPTLLLLLSLPMEKAALVRACGVIWFLGSTAFLAGHISTGVLNVQTGIASAAMLPAALLGMWLGQLVQDRLPLELLRRMILAVLVVAGVSLIGRAVFS